MNFRLNRIAIRAILAAGVSLTAISAHAANMARLDSIDGYNVVAIEGEITGGDADKFQQITSGLKGSTIITINSLGGKVVEGLQIAENIHDRHFLTLVQNNASCASICGIMWLAGSTRHSGTAAHIGFHAASNADGTESGAASAMIGAFLGQLGLSYNAIYYITSAPPSGINWLSAAKAKELGITVTVHQPTPTAAAPAAAPVASRPVDYTVVSFEMGRHERQSWEAWFTGLPTTDYRTGTEWWTEHRSLKPQPSCFKADASVGWTAGCAEAMRRLAPVDAKRELDKNFRAGWNSV
jgi:hypothetical protein